MNTTETFDKQYPLALHAIADHIEKHDLPLPWSIDRSTHEKISVLLTTGTTATWLATVHVDAEASEIRGLSLRSEYSVRLPDTGIRLELVGYRSIPLTAVPA